MPSTASDLANLLTGGGTQNKPSSLLKGMFSALVNTKPAAAGAATAADFQSLLDAPIAVVVGAAAILDQPGEDDARSVLTTESSAVPAAFSQVRGMVVRPSPSTLQDGSALAVDVAATELPMSAAANEAVPEVEILSSSDSKLKNSTPGARGSASGRGHARLSGRLSEATCHTKEASLSGGSRVTTTGATQSKAVQSPAAATSPKAAPATGCELAAAAEIIAASGGNIIPATIAASGGTPPIVDDTASTDDTIAATVDAEPAADPTIILTHSRGMRSFGKLPHQASQACAPTEGRVPATEAFSPPAEVQTEALENGAPTAIAPEVRREVIETVAALLAPLWATLTQALPAASAAAPAQEQTGESGATSGGEPAQKTAITIRVGGLPPFTLQIPVSSAAPQAASPLEGALVSAQTTGENQINSPLAASSVLPRAQSDGTTDETAPAGNLPLVVPALDSLSSETLPLDFRIELKAKIEAAWKQADALGAGMTAEQIPSVANEAETARDWARPGWSGGLVANIAKRISPASTPAGLGAVPMVPAARQGQVTPVQGEKTSDQVEVTIELPGGLGTVEAQIMAGNPPANAAEKRLAGRFGRAEKTAGDFKSIRTDSASGNISSKKTFLSEAAQTLKSKSGDAGTDVAISRDNMPAIFTSRRVAVDQLELPPRISARELLLAVNESQGFAPPADSPAESTPAPVLAHRAVETIMNVVDAQRQGSANASSVNLHFKFGGEDLAVRVQMRGGEVLTQFLTDSPDLRKALSNEWQIMAGQGGPAGLRVLDPVIMPNSAGVSTGFGSASQGQNQAQQNAQHQQAQTGSAFPEMRALLRGTTVVAPVTESAPRVSIAQPTSHHLTAMA